MEQDVRPQKQAARFDPLVDELRVLRESRGVTYRELAARITRQRENDGVTPAKARIAHTTVSDGTAVVALIGGPWLAALVGLLFVVVELLKFQIGGALFAVTMIFAGLIWGYGVRRGWGATLPRFLAVSAVVAVATSALAVPITMLYYDGQVGRGLDVLFAYLQAGGLGPWLAVSGTNLTVSLVDKVLTGAIAFLIARLIWTSPGAAEHGFAPRR